MSGELLGFAVADAGFCGRWRSSRVDVLLIVGPGDGGLDWCLWVGLWGLLLVLAVVGCGCGGPYCPWGVDYGRLVVHGAARVGWLLWLRCWSWWWRVWALVGSSACWLWGPGRWSCLEASCSAVSVVAPCWLLVGVLAVVLGVVGGRTGAVVSGVASGAQKVRPGGAAVWVRGLGVTGCSDARRGAAVRKGACSRLCVVGCVWFCVGVCVGLCGRGLAVFSDLGVGCAGRVISGVGWHW